MQFQTNYPILLIVASALLATFVSYWLYRKNPLKLTQKWMVYGVMGLRWLSLFFICFLLLEPLIKWLNQHKEKPILVIAFDNSQSMLGGKDKDYLQSQFLPALNLFKKNLADQFNVITYTIGSEVKRTDSLSFTDKISNLSGGLEEIENNYFQTNHAATLLISDGMYNAGSNPAYALNKNSPPVFTIGIGDTTQRKDAIIQKAYAPTQVYANNDFEIMIDLQAFYCAGEALKIEVRENQKLLFSATKMAVGPKYFQQQRINLNKTSEGFHTYDISIAPLKAEASYINNKVSVQVNSLKNKQHLVLVYQNAHPDIGAMQRAISKLENYSLEALPLSQINAGKLPEAALYILHQIPGTRGEGLPLLKQIQTKNIPCFFIVGKQNGLPFLAQINGSKIIGNAQNQNEAQAWVNTQFNLFQLDELSLNTIQKFNPLITPYGSYQISAGTEVLLNQQIGFVKTNTPLLSFSYFGGTNQSMLFGEGIWRWFLQDYLWHGNQQISENLLSKIIQWTAGKSDRSKFRVEPSKKIFDENEAILIDATLFNDLQERVNSFNVSLQLTDEKGKNFQFQFSKTNDAYQLQIKNLLPGKYSYSASADGGNYPIKKGEILVKSMQLESIQTKSNFEALRAISQESGGEFYATDNLKILADKLANNPNMKTVIHEQEQLKSLLEYKFLFFLILLLLSTEWFVRKWQGLI